MKQNIFWSSFFFVLGFTQNPFLAAAKEILNKPVDQRISESWETTSKTFGNVFDKETN